MITSYTYDGTQVDRLASFGGKAITYDANGCVNTYDSWTYTWTKGKLTKRVRGTRISGIDTYTYTYDAYGRRTQKKYTYTPGSLTQVDYIKAETTSYTYDNSGRLVNERCVSVYNDNSAETHEFTYLYDESGIVGAMFSKNGVAATPYYYRRNLQGDVTAIYDQNGVCKAEYAYDAWGNCTVTNSGDFSIAYTNPILYRGYYYDRSTGLYYLNARYYNPQWRRFISPDSTDYIDPENVNGLNLYCYCNNDPVNYADPSGRLAVSLTVIGLIFGAVIGATVGGVAAYNIAKDNGAEGWELFGWTALGALGGGIVGGAIGAGIGALATKLTGIVGFSITKYSILPVKNITLLGHYDTYREIAKTINAGVYYILPSLYDYLKSIGQEWSNNLQYLIDANSLGTQFVISPEYVVLSTGTLWQEIQYLISNNIPWLMP